MKKLNEITIADLMPDSISGDAQVSATARAIDPQLRLISEAVDRPLILAAIDDLSAGVLEHLAVQYDVTSWDSAWPIETKRAVLKTAIADKRKKGTRGAVERAIEAVAPIATLTEWWQDTSGDMPPHTFKIDLLQDGSAVDPETQANVIAQVEDAKPVRSHYAFRVGQLLGGDLYFAGVLRAISYARVRSAGISIEQTNIDAGVLAALRGMSIRRLLASSHMGEMPEPTVVEQYRYGMMSTDSESTDLIPFDESEFALMQSTGVQQSYGEFIYDAGLNFVMSQNELMESTGIQQSYGEFIYDDGLNFVMSQNELMEIWDGIRVQEYNLLDAATSKLAFSSASEIQNILIPLHSLPDSGLSDPTPPPPEYEDLTLYLQSGSSKNMQFSATSATTTMSKAGYSSDVVYQLYTDSGRSVAFTPDLTKIYKIGYYDGTEWKEFKYQSIESMPETVTSNLSNSVSCFIILNSGLLWLLTDLNRTVSINTDEITVRAYSDNREWTTETLYLEAGTKQYQPGITCYSSSTPNTAGTAYKQLYTDSSCTTKFNYDLDRDYLAIFGDGEIRRVQSVWDMPTTTGSGSLGAVLYKTGFVYFITNSNGTITTEQTSVLFKSTPKHYDEPTITLDLGLNGASAPAVTFGANDWWYAYLRNPLDKQKAHDFGLTFYIGSDNEAQLSNAVLNSFNIEILALCDAYENTVLTNMSNFSVGTRNNDRITINSVNAYSTATNYWRVRITKKTT